MPSGRKGIKRKASSPTLYSYFCLFTVLKIVARCGELLSKTDNTTGIELITTTGSQLSNGNSIETKAYSCIRNRHNKLSVLKMTFYSIRKRLGRKTTLWKDIFDLFIKDSYSGLFKIFSKMFIWCNLDAI